MASTVRSILIFGLKPLPNAAGPWTVETVPKAINQQITVAKDAGYDLTVHQIDSAVSTETTMEEVRSLLRTRAWDCVGVGYGVRGNLEMTPLFEMLVNAAVEEVKPVPKFSFATSPTLLFEGALRVLRNSASA